ncbi:MAG: uroporphyrinogen III methyltransferase/synthase [Candidatus Omnitrophota bacterium]|jgi:uroporphyrinogen III methyltransferase/synthase
MPVKGKVYLVGAGPGDPKLITQKGLELLKVADAVIYDDLISPHLLRHCPKETVLVYAGKKSGRPSLSQQTINQTLAALANEHEYVIRLKGGDSMIFSRGAEECLHLNKSGVEFEIVPGITSAIGSAAYAGIPLTERKHSSSIAFVTAYRARGSKQDKGYWQQLIKAVDTLCVYMATSRLVDITNDIAQIQSLKKLPIAVIERGTQTKQKSVYGNVSTICDLVKLKKIKSPAMVIIGKSVSLHNHLSWFENKPLFGKRIVVTRAAKQSMQLVTALEGMGAEVLNLPTIHIGPPKDYASLDQAIKNIEKYQWLLFTSVNAVEFFFNRYKGKFKKDSRHLYHNKIAAIGPQTSKALLNYGLQTDLIPELHTSVGVVKAFNDMPALNQKTILLIRPESAPIELNRQLKKSFKSVATAHAYRNTKATQQMVKSLSFLEECSPDMITFTSASTVKHLFSSLGKGRVLAWLGNAKCISIGPMTTSAIKAAGLNNIHEAKQATITSMLEALDISSIKDEVK